MANVHYGEIGDVWKHLPLAEVLSIELPRIYWESHAGSSRYPLVRSAERDYGVLHFASHAHRSPVLDHSVYRRLLERQGRDGRMEAYPGSPLIAMTLLGKHHGRFLFCDLDGGSLSTIRESARELGLLDTGVRTEKRDGVAMLDEELAVLPREKVSETFVHVDPYDPLAADSDGLTSVDLFRRASASGVKSMLWYGFDSAGREAGLLEEISQIPGANGTRTLEPRIWRGEISLGATDVSELGFHPGVLGCGVILGNVGDESLAACERLGKELVSIYAETKLPGGHSGALRFEHGLV